MRKILAFLLAIFMITPLFTQIIALGADDLSYTKNSIAYTVCGEKYYGATLNSAYNGVTAGTEFFVDVSGNVVTDTALLKKLNAVKVLVQNNLVNLNRNTISGNSDRYLINMVEACEVWINNVQIASYLGSAAVAAIKTTFDLANQDYDAVIDDVIDFGINSFDTVEAAKAALLSAGIIDAAAYVTKYYNHKKNVFEYPINIYDYEQLEEFFFDFASLKASENMAQKICDVTLEDMLSNGTSILDGANVTFKNLTDSLIESIFDSFDDEFLNLIGDFYSAIKDVYDEGQDNLFINHSAFYNESYNSNMNTLFYAFCKASNEMVKTHAKLSAKQTPSSSYTTGTYTPSEYNGLNIRSGASTSNSIVGAIAQGTNFVVTDVNGIWGYTTCNGVSGWVCLDYATKVNLSSGNVNSYENTYNNTGNQRDDILGVANTQIGYKENSNGYNKYAQSTAEWCAYFVLWCAEQAGISSSIIPRYAGCRQLYNGVISCGGTVVTEPIAGDLIFYRCTKCTVGNYSDAYSHVGIALDSTYSIEGNRSGRVDKFISANYGGEPHYVSTGDVKIIYVRPNYKNDTTPSSKLSAPKITSSSAFTSDENVVLSWELDGADYYGITVVNDQTNATVFDGDISESTLNLGKLASGKYRWQVRGYNDTGWGELSSLMHFTVNSTSNSDGSLVTRDDGTWLFPVAKEYYQKFSDWCCCPGYDKCVLCGTAHTSWGDSSHSGQKGHNGIDLATPSGTPVYAAASGKYYTGGSNSHDRGYYVVIEHNIGNGQAYYSAYQHLSKFNTSLQSGQHVNAGDLIGYTGGSGNGSGVHLHFGIVLGASGKGLNGLDTYELWNSSNPWATSPGHTQGRIVNNPADNFPTSTAGATLEAIIAHKGSVHYTFDKTKVSINSENVQESKLPGEVEITIVNNKIFSSSEEVVITWKSATNAVKYGLTVRNDTTNATIIDGDFTGNSKSLGVLPAGKYRYQMRAYNSDGVGGELTAVMYFSVAVHEHDYSDEWLNNRDEHWRKCTGCDSKTEITEHGFDNACDTTCNVCGYIRKITHSYSNEWLNNSAEHWHECTVCGNKTDKAPHSIVDVACQICGKGVIVGVTAVMSSATATFGDTVVLTVDLMNASLTDALSFELTLPEGISLIEGKNTCWEIESLIDGINVSTLQGVWVNDEEINPNGIVLSLELKIEENAFLGANEILFEFYSDDTATGKTEDAVSEVAGVIYVHDYVAGDIDGEEGVDAKDAIYLLYNVFFGDGQYPVDQPCDFNGDDTVDASDAIYLLYHVFFGDKTYPLN